MPFSSVLGHESIIEGLRAAWERDRVPHAYLFSGPEGVGKAKAAVAFLQLINCTAPSARDSCGECRPCRQIASGRHPDFIEVERDGRFIKIDRVREITKMLRFPPVEARTRAVLVHEAEAMHEAAANAILKTLEEPSPRNIFVLVTAQPYALLTTIRSRCQEVRFSVLPRETVSGWLHREKHLDLETADEIAGMSSGSLGAAEKLIDPELTALRSHWLGALRDLPGASPTGLLGLAEALSADKAQMPSVLDALRIGLRDTLLRASGAPDTELTFRRHGHLPPMSTEGALSALDIVDEAERALRMNVNPRMVGERLLLGIRQAMQ